MPSRFNKRIYDLPAFRNDISTAIGNLDELREAGKSGRVSAAFRERIMLAVTNVNQCRYCNFGHTRAALAAGVSDADIRNLALGEFDKLPEDEIVALIFAQHYAETGGDPDPEAWSKLQDTYGEDTARDIRVYIRMITIGNLSGNTFDALISRLKFNPAPDSSLTQELGVLLGAFIIIPYEIVKSRFQPRRRSGAAV